MLANDRTIFATITPLWSASELPPSCTPEPVVFANLVDGDSWIEWNWHKTIYQSSLAISVTILAISIGLSYNYAIWNTYRRVKTWQGSAYKHRKTGRIHGRRTTKAETHYCRNKSSKINNNNNNNNRIWKEASLLQKKVGIFAVMHHSLLLHMTEVKSSIVALSVSCSKCMCA